MNEIVDEWIQKADGDFRTAERELHSAEDPNFDAACYHAQQCVEKMLKALLISRKIMPPRTHNLSKLVELLKPGFPNLQFEVADLDFLTLAGVAFRYPGVSATRENAERAVSICERLRQGLSDLLRGDQETRPIESESTEAEECDGS